MVETMSSCLRWLGGNRAGEVAFGRFLRNPKVTTKELLEQAGTRLSDSVEGLHVLAIQDTTEINYQAHAGKVTGLGPVGNGRDMGFFLHPVIAVEADSRHMLGLCGAEIWERTVSKAAKKKKLPIEEKESYRWVQGAQSAQRVLKSARQITIVGDRESDIYELWASLSDSRPHVLTRAYHNRCLSTGGKLYEFLDALPVQHRYSIEIPARTAGQKARQAELEVRFSEVTFQRPQNCQAAGTPETLRLQAIDVREASPPAETEAVHWRLLTTHAVASAENAVEVIEWYRQRWHIEQVFRTLKHQGLNVEASQIETAESLEKFAVLALLSAIRVMQLVNARQGQQERPASDVFEPEEISVLQALQGQCEGKTQAQKNPFPTATLAWSTWIIARLGGWKGYKSERPPGPITIRNGLQEFYALFRGWQLAKVMCIP
jgi:Transposase DDE domain